MKKGLAFTGLLTLAAPVLMATSAFAADDPNALLNPDGTKSHIQYQLSAQDQANLNEKLQLAQEYANVRAGKADKAAFEKHQAAFEAKVNAPNKAATNSSKTGSSGGISPNLITSYSAAYQSNYITTLYQEAQITNYYCGPATVAEMVKGNGFSVTQNQAASYMGTTTNGTDWSNSSGYPVKNALNYYMNTGWYEPYGTSVNSSTLETNITYDIDHGYPVAGDAWEVPGGPHLVGHPTNATIFHWFAIDGYKDYGATTHYADSVANATSISWYASVPQYSFLSTSTIATILDGRGAIL